ncbi:hypothetical protein A0H81_14143 [Grifola frondosa]|uniref:Uncharacterized protein n=1 Tax=Grifola frondosa TaxID=5627 RepID=A0A1C7LMF6_GRIFR|nr:hypothetical protein A0H81_14143 [Grifola frondosa]
MDPNSTPWYSPLNELDDDDLDDPDWEPDSDSGDDLEHSRQREPSDSPHRQRTRRWRAELLQEGDISARVKEVLEFMKSRKLDLPLLLWAISWNVQDLVQDTAVQFERTALTSSEELPELFHRWYKPPRGHNRGIKSKGASCAITRFALDWVGNVVNQEMSVVGIGARESTDAVVSLASLRVDHKAEEEQA